jgi:hypothetical protein
MDIGKFTNKLEAHIAAQSNAPRTNEARADEGVILAECFGLMSGVDPSPSMDGPVTASADMLAQIMHWARRDGWDFDAALQTATSNFQAEVCRVCGGTSEDAGICHDCLDAVEADNGSV